MAEYRNTYHCYDLATQNDSISIEGLSIGI